MPMGVGPPPPSHTRPPGVLGSGGHSQRLPHPPTSEPHDLSSFGMPSHQHQPPPPLPPASTATTTSSGSSFGGSISLTNTTEQFGHCPKARDGPALGCNYCWNTTDVNGRILRRKTKYHCPECQANLCIVPCFQAYHEALENDKNNAGSGGPASSKLSR